MNGHDSFTFNCSICGEPSNTICRYCTHDACENHLCERCGCCSDCCSCDIHQKANGQALHLPGDFDLPHKSEGFPAGAILCKHE